MSVAVRAGYKMTEVGVIPEDWLCQPLNDLIDPLRPIGYGIVQTGKSVRNGVKCVRVVDMIGGQIDAQHLISTSEEISVAYKRTLLRARDVVIALRGKIGAVAVIQPDLAGANLTRGVALLSNSGNFDSSYLAQYLSSTTGKSVIERNLNGSALQEIPIAALRKLPAVVPPLPEQRAIATALSDVDALLAKLDALVAKKRDLKVATMQRLLTGQTRLPGFSGEWEVKRLGDLATMGSGGTPTSSVSTYYDGDYPWVSISDMTKGGKVITQTDKNLSATGLENSAAQMFPAGTILYAMYASLGECSLAGMPLCTSQAILGIRPQPQLNGEYLYYFLTSLKSAVKSMGQQGTQANLNKGMVQAFQISLPPLDEQFAIAKVLFDMDAELTALEARRDKTRAIKQGMMQELLTGRIRLA